jgi:hypothetical protein
MQHARNGLRVKHLEEARASFARLGIEPTPLQLSEATERLLKAAQRDRLAAARVNRWKGHAESQRAADVEWATDAAMQAADRIKALYPTVSVDANVFKVCLMAVADELDAPDGFNRTRLISRLDLYVKAVMQECSRMLAATLPELTANVDGVDFDGTEPWAEK